MGYNDRRFLSFASFSRIMMINQCMEWASQFSGPKPTNYQYYPIFPEHLAGIPSPLILSPCLKHGVVFLSFCCDHIGVHHIREGLDDFEGLKISSSVLSNRLMPNMYTTSRAGYHCFICLLVNIVYQSEQITMIYYPEMS